MSEMIQRVAQAMDGESLHRTGMRIDDSVIFHLAAAAIKAMREPTENIRQVKTLSIHYGADEIWSMMIDAALK